MPGKNTTTTNRSSLSQDRGGSSLGQSYMDVRSIGSTATRHWVNSVSDIYGPDEIEELLEDLNRLELAGGGGGAGEEDFDINGSQLGGRKKNKRGNHNSSSRNSRGSPTFSVKSWDSHAVYQDCPAEEEEEEEEEARQALSKTAANSVDAARTTTTAANVKGAVVAVRPNHPQLKSSKGMVLCFCETSSLRTSGGVLRVLLLVTSLACLCTILAAGTATVGLFALPHFPKLRIMMFICIFTVLFTAFVLFLNISHMDVLLPFDVGRMQTVVYLLLTIFFLTLSILILQVHRGGDFLVADDDDNPEMHHQFHLPRTFWTKNHLLIAAVLGFCCTVESFLCSCNCGRIQPNSSTAASTSDNNKTLMQESSTHVTLHDLNAVGGGTNISTRQVVENVPLQQVVTNRHHNENFYVNKSAAKHNHHPHPAKPSAPPPSPPPPPPPSSSTKPKQDNAAAGKKTQANPPASSKQTAANPSSKNAAPTKQTTSNNSNNPTVVPHKQTAANNNNNNPAVATAPPAAATKQTSSSHKQQQQQHSKQQPAQPPPSKKTASSKKPPPPPSSSSSDSDSSSGSSSSRSSTSLAMAKAPPPSSQPNPNGKERREGQPSRLKTKALVSSEPSAPPSVPPPAATTTTSHGYSSSSQGQGHSSSSSEPYRSTGAIPKSKKARPPPLVLPSEPSSSKVNNPGGKPSTNHLDEIIALPEDSVVSPNKNGGQRRKHYVH